jgi:hypothetical protein
VKSKLHQEQLCNEGRKLQCAQDVVTFLEESLSTRVASSYPDKKKKKRDIYRKFWHIGENEVPRKKKWDCNPILGTSTFHSVSFVSVADNTKLAVRELSCFCVPCQMKEWDQCENLYNSRLGTSYVPRWRFLRIQVKPYSRDVQA